MTTKPFKCIGYVRVSTEEQGDSRLGINAQKKVITDEANRRGWTLERIHVEVASGASMRKRDELALVLNALSLGDADALVVAKLDRLSRSVPDFANMMELAVSQGWAITVLDMGIDTTSTTGKLIMHILIALAQWEREMIGDRTREALAQVVARGGVLGRKPTVSQETRAMIRALRSTGLSWQKIANTLIEQKIPTGQGGQWHAQTVRRIHIASDK